METATYSPAGALAILTAELNLWDRLMARFIARGEPAPLDCADHYHNLDRAMKMLEPAKVNEVVNYHYLAMVGTIAIGVYEAPTADYATRVAMAHASSLSGDHGRRRRLSITRIEVGDWLVLSDNSVAIVEQLSSLISWLRVRRIDPTEGLAAGAWQGIAVANIAGVVSGAHADLRTHAMVSGRALCGHEGAIGTASTHIGCQRCNALLAARR